ncbi:uncharacterized protein TNCV_1778891 [Trichonephila clavipes]|nr:uncharacterized protein TNCV_1778891 [Trichonephila clavipes]
MDVCKDILHTRQRFSLNIRRTTCPPVKLVEGKKATRGLFATNLVILSNDQVTWTAPELAPLLLTTTPHQREDVSALDRFNVHRCPTQRIFSGTGLKLRHACHDPIPYRCSKLRLTTSVYLALRHDEFRGASILHHQAETLRGATVIESLRTAGLDDSLGWRVVSRFQAGWSQTEKETTLLTNGTESGTENMQSIRRKKVRRSHPTQGAVGPDIRFMKETSRLHRAHIMDYFLENENIHHNNWTMKYSDLYHVEHISNSLKRAIAFPYVAFRTLQPLNDELLDEWNLLLQAFHNTLINRKTDLKRMAAVAEWYRHRIVAGFVTSSSPVPLKTRRVGQRCTLNLSRAEMSSRWCGS